METTFVTKDALKNIVKNKSHLKEMHIERRKYPRCNLNLPIKICDSNFDVVTETKNISGNGAYCVVNKEIPVMTKLNIVLLLPVKNDHKKGVKKINCKGVVVRSEYNKNNGQRSYNLGIYFNEIKESDRKQIISYTTNSLPKS